MFSHRRTTVARPHNAPSRRPGQAGETLIEVLVTVVLLGTIITAILGGMLAAAKVADQNHQSSRAMLTVENYVEQLKQPVVDPSQTELKTFYRPCAVAYSNPPNSNTMYPIYRGEADSTLFPGFRATVVDIKYLQDPNIGASGPVWGSSCTPVSTPYPGEKPADPQTIFVTDNGLQELFVEVTSGVGVHQVKETIVVVKRDQRCSPVSYYNDNPDTGPC